VAIALWLGYTEYRAPSGEFREILVNIPDGRALVVSSASEQRIDESIRAFLRMEGNVRQQTSTDLPFVWNGVSVQVSTSNSPRRSYSLMPTILAFAVGLFVYLACRAFGWIAGGFSGTA